jgi:hypothetical protein
MDLKASRLSGKSFASGDTLAGVALVLMVGAFALLMLQFHRGNNQPGLPGTGQPSTFLRPSPSPQPSPSTPTAEPSGAAAPQPTPRPAVAPPGARTSARPSPRPTAAPTPQPTSIVPTVPPTEIPIPTPPPTP